MNEQGAPDFVRYGEMACEARICDQPDERTHCGRPSVDVTGGLIPVCAAHLAAYRHAVGLDEL